MMITPRTAVSALIATGLVLPACLPSAVAEESTLELRTVLATNKVKSKTREIDPKLDSIRPTLKPLPFKSYTQLQVQTHDLSAGDQCGVDLPGNRYFQVTVVERSANAMKLRVVLNENNRPIVNTDVRLQAGQNVLIGGPRSGTGTLLVSIRANDILPAAAKGAPLPAPAVPAGSAR